MPCMFFMPCMFVLSVVLSARWAERRVLATGSRAHVLCELHYRAHCPLANESRAQRRVLSLPRAERKFYAASSNAIAFTHRKRHPALATESRAQILCGIFTGAPSLPRAVPRPATKRQTVTQEFGLNECGHAPHVAVMCACVVAVLQLHV